MVEQSWAQNVAPAGNLSVSETIVSAVASAAPTINFPGRA
jgi:hypothetical protein